MMVADLRCWRLFSMYKIGHQHLKLVTNTFCLQHLSLTSMSPFQIWTICNQRLLKSQMIQNIPEPDSKFICAVRMCKYSWHSVIHMFTRSSSGLKFLTSLAIRKFESVIEIGVNWRTLTYLAPSTHWEFSFRILKLNAKMAPEMSGFFNWLPLHQKMVTVMLVTSLCCWLYNGDWF